MAKKILARNLETGRIGKTHGHGNTPTYHRWEGMIQRCHNPNHTMYGDYGAKGIIVCERWRKSFQAFLDEMGICPSPWHQLDRFPNQNGNYEPGNVRWATLKEQHRNKKSNVLLTFDGRTQCSIAWAEETGITKSTISKRLAAGWSAERILTTPMRNYPRPIANG